jgi:hypothetical protein
MYYLIIGTPYAQITEKDCAGSFDAIESAKSNMPAGTQLAAISEDEPLDGTVIKLTWVYDIENGWRPANQNAQSLAEFWDT